MGQMSWMNRKESLTIVCILLVAWTPTIALGDTYHPTATTTYGAVVPAYFIEESAVYYVKIYVGEPPQMQTMVLDTGIDVTFLVEKSTCPHNIEPEPSLQCFDTDHSTTLRVTSSHASFPREYCRISADYFRFEGLSNSTATDFIFCLSTFDPSAYNQWTWDGILGMNYVSSGSEFEPVTDIWPEPWANVYSLDFNGRRNDSWLYIGGADSIEGLLWSETTVSRKPRNVEFTMFQPSICGESLYHESSNILLTAVATDSQCLGLPEDLYQQVMNWIDGDCEEDDEEAPGSFHCTFPADTFPGLAYLPSFAFKLSQDGSDLYIPLSLLATEEISLNSEVTRVSLCIDNMKTLYNSNTYSLFGNRVLEALYMVVDMRIRRVGFRQKIGHSEAEVCSPKPNCFGAQTYDGASNSCIDPPCSDYFLQVVDKDTMTCRTSLWFYTIAIGLVSILFAGEVVVSQANTRMARIATANAHRA